MPARTSALRLSSFPIVALRSVSISGMGASAFFKLSMASSIGPVSFSRIISAGSRFRMSSLPPRTSSQVCQADSATLNVSSSFSHFP